MDEFLKAATKELGTAVLHPRPDGPSHLFESYRCPRRSSLIFWRKMDVVWRQVWTYSEGAVRLRDSSSQLPPWRFARCETQRCQVAAKCSSCASEPFLCWSVAVWNSSVYGSPALDEIHAINPPASLKTVAMTFPAPAWVSLPTDA